MVIRRFDAVLEPTKTKVLKLKERLDKAGIADQDIPLQKEAGEQFVNSSPYILNPCQLNMCPTSASAEIL